METDEKELHFFLATNSAVGFYSMFNQIYIPNEDWKGYIIKGGPGTGKSSIMRKVASTLKKYGEECIKIHCSSDPDSLDAVIFPKMKLFLADGTPPHTMEPKYPGAVENILNLGEFWDQKKLRNKRSLIIEYNDSCSLYHSQSSRFISAAGMLKYDSYRLVLPLVNKRKIEHFTKRLILSICKEKKKSISGNEQKVFLSGITPKGIITLQQTIPALCDTIYLINDPYGPVGNLILNYLKKDITSLGIDVISCLSPIFPENIIEHLIVPKYHLAFITSNQLNKITLSPNKRINSLRFIDTDMLKIYKPRLNFNKRSCQQILNEAINLQKLAKNVHDKLEECYSETMDFSKLEKYTDQFIKYISKQ